MGMGRFKRLSKEKPTEAIVHAAPSAPTKEEVSEINNLIKATKGGEHTSPLKQRRISSGITDPNKMQKTPESRPKSAEAAAINNLIKQNKSDGGQSLRERRRSKEIAGETAGEKTPPSSNRRESINDKVRFLPFAIEQIDKTQQLELEAKAINQRISEDRRVRRVSKELLEAEKAAHAKISAMSREVEAAEAEAEKQELEHGAALSGAQARGAAKAAAVRAGGVYVPTSEYAGLHEELKQLKLQVTLLKDEKQASQSLFQKLAAKFQTAVDVDSGSNSSPELNRSPSQNSKGRRRRHSDSIPGASFVRKVLESTDGNSSPSNSFVNKVLRSVSPGKTRATSPSGRHATSKQQKSAHFTEEDDEIIPTGHVLSRPPPPAATGLTVV